MSGSPGGGPPEDVPGRGPPEDVPGRGPPKRVRERFKRATRDDDGTISVGDEPLQQLADRVDWDNLSPLEQYVLAVLDDEGLLPDGDE